jgi:hypothetical protein
VVIVPGTTEQLPHDLIDTHAYTEWNSTCLSHVGIHPGKLLFAKPLPALPSGSLEQQNLLGIVLACFELIG